MISKRLMAISQMATNNSNLADIGSDHGYLLLLLRMNGFKGKLLGVENKEGPFNILYLNIKNSKFNDSINVSFSDGLDKVDNNFNEIVIAGMGFETIRNIICKNINKVEYISSFIIDSHTKCDDLRKFMNEIGYKIVDEKIIYEAKKYYEIIKFSKGYAEYNNKELYFGPILLKERSVVFINKYQEKLKNIENIINKLKPESELYKKYREEISFIKSNIVNQ